MAYKAGLICPLVAGPYSGTMGHRKVPLRRLLNTLPGGSPAVDYRSGNLALRA
jgi:hypothetical protein